MDTFASTIIVAPTRLVRG